MSRWRWLVVVAGVIAGSCVALAPAASASAGTDAGAGTLYVVQGIAGTSGSVTVDGRTVAQDVAAKTVVGPLRVEPGAHTVQLWQGATPIAQGWFTATSGSSTDLVAHRFPDASAAPAFTTYANNVSPTPRGQSRLLVAHTAVAPPTNIVVNGQVLIRNLANGEFAANVVPAGRYTVAVVPTATTGPPILGPSSITLDAGKLVNVFAIGDASAGRMDAVVQVLAVGTRGSAPPSSVQTGDGGQAAGLFPENRHGVPPAPMAVAGSLVVLAGLHGLQRRRAAARTSRARS